MWSFATVAAATTGGAHTMSGSAPSRPSDPGWVPGDEYLLLFACSHAYIASIRRVDEGQTLFTRRGSQPINHLKKLRLTSPDVSSGLGGSSGFSFLSSGDTGGTSLRGFSAGLPPAGNAEADEHSNTAAIVGVHPQ